MLISSGLYEYRLRFDELLSYLRRGSIAWFLQYKGSPLLSMRHSQLFVTFTKNTVSLITYQFLY
jgi:hypothetical protein